MQTRPPSQSLRLMLCGDVMTGRGIDQALAHPSDPRLYESFVKDARDYLRLAEARNGPIARPLGYADVWGDALAALQQFGQPPRILNLETAVTRHDRPWPDKGINYRMHPDNAPALAAFGADVCVLANNHVLDWGVEGLHETISTLRAHGIGCAGAGSDAQAAEAPAMLKIGQRRLQVFGFALASSGVPAGWAATRRRPGVNYLPDLGERSLAAAVARIRAHAQPGDLIVVSLHWGPNWGYAIPAAERSFARALIDEAGAALVHGHSSHHPKGLERYRGRLILYGCGDFLNDYEGIEGYEEYRPDRVLMYLPTLDAASGELLSLRLVPLRIRRFRLERASAEDAAWLAARLTRESAEHGLRFAPAADPFHSLEAAL